LGGKIMDDISKKVDPEAIKRAVNILKRSVGEKDVSKLEETFKNKNNLNALASKFSEKELEEIIKIINNPAMMQKKNASVPAMHIYLHRAVTSVTSHL
jgi:aspartate carbamoyltransferase regulatory subunit